MELQVGLVDQMGSSDWLASKNLVVRRKSDKKFFKSYMIYQ